MEAPTKEEIARVDRVHRRADEAVAQIAAGHIITECIVLYPDENDGNEAKWTMMELGRWPAHRERMIETLKQDEGHALSLLDQLGRIRGFDLDVHPRYLGEALRGRIMYRQSAAFVASQPAIDPYTKSDRAG